MLHLERDLKHFFNFHWIIATHVHPPEKIQLEYGVNGDLANVKCDTSYIGKGTELCGVTPNFYSYYFASCPLTVHYLRTNSDDGWMDLDTYFYICHIACVSYWILNIFSISHLVQSYWVLMIFMYSVCQQAFSAQALYIAEMQNMAVQSALQTRLSLLYF